MSTLKPMIGTTLDHPLLKRRHRLVRDEHPTSLKLRKRLRLQVTVGEYRIKPVRLAKVRGTLA